MTSTTEKVLEKGMTKGRNQKGRFYLTICIMFKVMFKMLMSLILMVKDALKHLLFISIIMFIFFLASSSEIHSDFLINEGLSFGWVESTNSLVHVVVSSEHEVLHELPFAGLFELLHVRAISVLLKVLGSSGENSESTVSQGEEHLFEH